MPHVIADRYEPVELLGRGGMGAVWRARDRVLDREVAIKEVTPPAGLDDEQIGRVYTRTFREARSAARLDHPGIVTVYDVVEEDGRPWIVMQLVRARSLAAIIKEEGPLPPERVAALGLDLLDALRTAHAAGVVHRDVKPGNVLLPPDRAVLTDFGIATVAGDETITQTGAIIGSPAYLAPEQARRQRASPASDLWSLGATLYAAVEGRSPYQRPDVWGVIGALLADEPDPPRRAGALAPVLHGLLRRDPGERAGHDEAERLLRRAAAGTPAPFAPPDSPAPVPPPPPHLTVDPGAGLPGGTPTSPPPGTVPPGTVPPGGVRPGDVRPGGVRTDGERHGPRWAVILPLGVFAVLLAAGVLSAAVFLTQSGEKNGRPGQAGSSAATASGNGSTGSPNVAVPAGYEPYRGPGFTVAVPKGWKAEASGDDVTFSDPAQGGRRGIAIQRIAENAADLGGSMADAAGRFENDTSYRDYRQVDFRRGFDYQGGDAAELEFTFTREGVAGRCRARVFRFNSAVYQTVLVTRADSWGQTVPYYETFLKTLRAE